MNDLFSQELGSRIAEIIKIPNLNIFNAGLVARAALDRPTKLGNDDFRSAFLQIMNTKFLEELKEAKSTNHLIEVIQRTDAERFNQFDEATRLSLRNTFRSLIVATRATRSPDQSKVEQPTSLPMKTETPYFSAGQVSNDITGNAIISDNSHQSLGKAANRFNKQQPRRASSALKNIALATLIIGFIYGLSNSSSLVPMLLAAWIGGPIYIYRKLRSTYGGIVVFG
jgi:lipopolysaccharide export LptBFGC system permease protein LptF